MDNSSIRSAGNRPPRQSRTGLTSTGARKAGSKSGRTRAREFALQGLYQRLVGGNTLEDIDAFTRDLAGFAKADTLHFDALLQGCVTQAEAVMWIGVFEFQHCLDVPWRVVLNECIELAKEFGGTDGHKYVNAVLNGLAVKLRVDEVSAERHAPGR
ncbi:MAG: transcription antitermination protein NusB [Burkholderiales bacterium]|nr:transcription antitermination protein NusB [Burkholderiales bacterium]